MSSHSTPLARALATGLLDDASLFPPARAPMEAALGLHALAGQSPWAFAQGHLLVPAAALAAVAGERALLGDRAPLSLGVIVGSPADPTAGAPVAEVARAVASLRAADPATAVAVFEHRPADQSPDGLVAAARDAAALSDELDGARAFIEVLVASATPDEVAERVAALADAGGVGAKVRCGGLEPGMVPSAAALASFVHACGRHGLAFKATAGLHHALAIPDGDARRHGFLNLLAATLAAADGADPAAIADLLARPDLGARATDETITLAGATWSTADVAAARAHFVAFGTCSFTEPLADLLAVPGWKGS